MDVARRRCWAQFLESKRVSVSTDDQRASHMRDASDTLWWSWGVQLLCIITERKICGATGGTEYALFLDGVLSGLFRGRRGGGATHKRQTVPRQAQHHSTAQSPLFRKSQRPCHLWHRNSVAKEQHVRKKYGWEDHNTVSHTRRGRNDVLCKM